jgi:hypothetical protein
MTGRQDDSRPLALGIERAIALDTDFQTAGFTTIP